MNSESSKSGGSFAKHQSFMIGGFIVDPKRMTVRIDGKTHQLSDLTWRFLLALVEAAPDTAKYDNLARSVWQQDHVSDETMAQRLRQLRKILGDDPKEPQYIRTSRGVGYQLIAEVTELTSIDETSVVSSNNRPRLKYALVSAFAVLGASVLWIWLSPIQEKTPTLSSQISIDELISRADAYRKRARLDANETSIELYQKALAIDENNHRALIGLSFSLSHKASKYGQSNAWADKAAALADKAILLSSESAGAFASRGMADDARGRVSSAIEYYKKSLKLDPEDQSIRSSTAYLLQIQGRYHEALRMEVQARKTTAPTYFSDYQIALALGLVGLRDASDEWLERAKLLRPENVFLNQYMAREFIKNGNLDEALDTLSKKSHQNSESYVLRALALYLEGQEVEALQAINSAFEVAKENDRACYECLAIYVQQGQTGYMQDIQKLLADAKTAIESGDEWPDYRIKLAYILLATGDKKEAMKSINKAYALGYRDWNWLETTPLFADLQNSTEFQKIIDLMKSDTANEKFKINSDTVLSNLL